MGDRVFNLTDHAVKVAKLDQLVGMIIHDSYHADQQRRFKPDVGENAERQASAFTVGVAERMGLSEDVIDIYRRDAITGHKPPSSDPKIKRPKKTKN